MTSKFTEKTLKVDLIKTEGADGRENVVFGGIMTLYLKDARFGSPWENM